MTDGEALRQAVVASPDDDTPRLIYADWLDENAHADRASLIRTQIDAARAEPFSPSAREAEARANRLLEVNRGRWARHVRSRLVENPRFHRGFIHHVAVEAAEFESAVEAVFAQEPVQSIRISRSDRPDEMASFEPVFKSERMLQVQRLGFTSRRGFFDIEHELFLKSSHRLEEVQALLLRGCGIHPAWFAELFRRQALPRLCDLDVAEITNLGPSLFHAFHKCRHRKLRSLDASGVGISSEHLQIILASECLSEVEELRLAGFAGQREPGPLNNLEIGWVMPWQKLRLLDLSGQRLGDDAARAIAVRPDAAALRWLGLANNNLTRDAVRSLVGSRNLNLYHLDVRGNRLSGEDVEGLRDRFPEAEVLGDAVRGLILPPRMRPLGSPPDS